MATAGREAFFAAIARLGVTRPWRVIVVLLVTMLGAGVVAPLLSVSTSRTSLVSDEDPQQKRTNAFYEAFGRPEAPLFVVSGGTAEQRQVVVDALTARLEEEEDLAGKVMGRLDPVDMAGVALLHQPEALGDLAKSLPPEVDVGKLISAGLDGWIGGIASQIEAGLDGGDEEDGAAAPEPAEIGEGLRRLGLLATFLDDALAGRDPMDSIAELPGASDSIATEGVDGSGYLITADGEHNLVPLYLSFASDEGTELEPIVMRLRSLRDEAVADAPAEVTAVLTGVPALSVDELVIVRNGLMSSSVAATIGIFGLCLLLFRSIRQTIVALLPLLPGIIFTLCAVYFLYGHLNLITSSFVAVLLGLGIDFSVHVIARRNEELRAGKDEVAAISTSISRTGPGIATGAIITAAAFLTNATTEFTAYGELGIVTAVGLIVILAVTLLLIPPLLVVGRKPDAPAPSAPPEPPGIAAVVGLVRRTKLLLTIAGVLLGIAGAVTLPRLEFNSRYFDFLPVTTESAQGLAALEYDALASPVFAAMRASSIEEARARAAALRAHDSVAGVQTPSDLLPVLDDAKLAALRSGLAAFGKLPDMDALAELPVDREAVLKSVRRVVDALDETRFALTSGGLPTDDLDASKAAFTKLAKTLEALDEDGQARLATIHRTLADLLGAALTTASAVAERGGYAPEDIPPRFAERFVSKDQTEVALFAVPAGSFWEVEVADQFAADVRTVDPDASGLAMVHVEHGQMVLAGFRRAAMYAAVIILLLLLLDFRSLSDALLALLPTGLGWLWMLALMPVVGLDFNVANIVALPLVIGIGIAFGVHMLHRLREPREEGSLPKIEDVVRGTGGAITVAASTTMVGFAGLMISEYGGMKSLGLTMVLGIGTCLVATVLVLPSVLLLLRRAE